MRYFVRQIVAVLPVLFLAGTLQLGVAQSDGLGAGWTAGEPSAADVQDVRQPQRSAPDDECQEEPGACILGTVLAHALAPIFSTLFTDLQGAIQPYRAPLGVRLEHRFRSVGSASRAHPYVGIGVRLFRESPSVRYRARLESYFEAAVGYQFALQPVVGAGSFVQRTAVLGTEAQWLSGRKDRFRVQVAPGLEIDRPSDRRLLVHLTLSVTAAGAEAGTVSPGLSLGYRW